MPSSPLQDLCHGSLLLPQGYIDGGISAGEDAAKAVLDLLQVEKAQGSSTHNSNTTRSSGNIKTELRSSRQEAPLPASTY